MAKKGGLKKQQNPKASDDPDAEARIQRVLQATGGHLTLPNPTYPSPPPDTRPLEERTIGKSFITECDADAEPEVRRSKRIAKVEADKANKTEVKVERRGTDELGTKRKSKSPPERVGRKKPEPETPAPRTPASQTPGKAKGTKPAKARKK